MESIVTTQVVDQLSEFINLAKKDPKAEVECKLLSGKIQTKDVADRIMKEIMTLSIGVQTEEHRLSISYTDGNRVVIDGVRNIQKLCVTNAFKEIPLEVQKKIKYFDGQKDIIDVPEASARFTLRSEQLVRKDWEGNPSDQ